MLSHTSHSWPTRSQTPTFNRRCESNEFQKDNGLCNECLQTSWQGVRGGMLFPTSPPWTTRVQMPTGDRRCEGGNLDNRKFPLPGIEPGKYLGATNMRAPPGALPPDYRGCCNRWVLPPRLTPPSPTVRGGKLFPTNSPLPSRAKMSIADRRCGGAEFHKHAEYVHVCVLLSPTD